jgi:4-amino-4-deoxy-L-arabinose transferase-like glycosyltransferase
VNELVLSSSGRKAAMQVKETISKAETERPIGETGVPGEARRWLLLILALFLVLAAVYNLTTPAFEAPDELEHTAYAVWLADGQGLPILEPAAPGPWEQEGTQPPLYYWAVARLLSWLPHSPAQELAELNPHANLGDPQRPDNKNRVLHNPHQTPGTWQEGGLFLRLTRFLSSLMACGTLLALYRLGRILFPDRPAMAVGMAGLVAFIPQFLFLSASVNNDNLIILIASWVLVLLAGWLRSRQPPSWPAVVALGVLLGLAALAKPSGLLLWPLAGGALVWVAWPQGRFRWLLLAGLVTYGAALALSGWWFVRNQQLYGDLTGLGPHLALMGARREIPSTFQAAMAEFRGFRYSFWALFGWFNILAPEAYYLLLDGLVALALIGLGLTSLRRMSRSSRPGRPLVVLLVAWITLVAAGLLRWTLWTPASQGRLLYPALGAIAPFLLLGWRALVPGRLLRPVALAGLALWIVWAVACPFLVIAPAYALPQRFAPEVDTQAALSGLGEVSGLDVQYGTCCRLLGYLVPDRSARPGDRLILTLVWQAGQPTDRDYSLFVHATTPAGDVLGQVDTYHGGGMYPTSQWQPGENIVERVYLSLSPQAQGPTLVRFNAGLYDLATGIRLPAQSATGQELEAVWLDEVALEPPAWPAPPPPSPEDTLFGGKIRLAGATLSAPSAQAGEVVTVTLLWVSQAQLDEDYVGFVHLLDAGGRKVAQDDHLPLDGRFPTRLWAPDTVLHDTYRLQLPPDLKEGTYQLWCGLYKATTVERLPAVAHASGQRWRDDLVSLGTLAVVAEQN